MHPLGHSPVFVARSDVQMQSTDLRMVVTGVAARVFDLLDECVGKCHASHQIGDLLVSGKYWYLSYQHKYQQSDGVACYAVRVVETRKKPPPKGKAAFLVFRETSRNRYLVVVPGLEPGTSAL